MNIKLIELDGGIFLLPKEIAVIFDFFINEDEPYENEGNAERFKKVDRTKCPRNATTVGVYCSESYLLFTRKSAYDNWRYYAGLEYEDDPDMINVGGDFIAIYDACNSERVEKLLSQLN